MSDDGLARLLARLDERAPGPKQREGHGRQSAAGPDAAGDVAAVVVSCSMGQRETPRSLWPVEAGATVAPVRTLGNQTWDCRDGHRRLDRSLGHLLVERDVRAVLVVGHTDCAVLADACERTVAPGETSAAGSVARLHPLVALVEEAVEEGVVDPSASPRSPAPGLVEYNVVRQVGFLVDGLPPTVTVAGYVHDHRGAYGAFPGRDYLVALDGQSSPSAIRSRLPDDATVPVGSVLG